MRRTVPELFQEIAAERGDAPALRAKRNGVWEAVSWREFHDLVRRAARSFIHLGHEPGQAIAIIGFNRLVMRRCKDILPPKQYDNLGKIAVSADQLLTLINSILDLSKIEAGRMDVNPTEAMLAPLLESCARTAEPLLQGKTVRLLTEIAPGIPPVLTDHDRLRQIVLNFLSNAAKFTERGTITLTGRADADNVVIAVTDTGIGIPDDQLATIFDEFSQIDSSSTRKYAGTGLGLAISRHLAELLGGGVSVRSTAGEGSTFTVSIPIRYQAPVPSDTQVKVDLQAEPERVAP